MGKCMLYYLWMWFLAWFRLSDYAVCWMSVGLDPRRDYHDYPDDTYGVPVHFAPLVCKRCGKGFYI